MEPPYGNAGNWLSFIRRYGMFVMVASLVWEWAHAPLYTIWTSGVPRDISFAVIHCTAGDLAIAVVCLVAALAIVGHPEWPTRRYLRVACASTFLGVAYTIYSERSNLESGAWVYSDAMPTVPPFGTGLSPLLQWVIIPLIGFAVARPNAPMVGTWKAKRRKLEAHPMCADQQETR